MYSINCKVGASHRNIKNQKNMQKQREKKYKKKRFTNIFPITNIFKMLIFLKEFQDFFFSDLLLLLLPIYSIYTHIFFFADAKER